MKDKIMRLTWFVFFLSREGINMILKQNVAKIYIKPRIKWARDVTKRTVGDFKQL